MSSPGGISLWRAIGDDLALHYAVRQRVFVIEQRVMELTDIDVKDMDGHTIHVLGAEGSRVAGTVRLYPLGDDLWQGDRLAVLPGHRSSMLGSDLVRFAVGTAAALGGARMRAQIQLPNVRFFERLGWERDGSPAPYCGFDHQPMMFDLARAPALEHAGRPAHAILEPLVEVPDLRAG